MKKIITKNEKQRKSYLDSIKGLAIMLVCITHYIAIACPQVFTLWHTRPYSFIFEGITGKLGVAILGVIMCSLARKSSESNPFKYLIKRYLYFMMAGAIINAAYVSLECVRGRSSFDGLLPFAEVTLSLGDKYFQAFWCMRPFFFASVLAYINGKNHSNVATVLIQMVILHFLNCDWIAICMLGYLISELIENERIFKILQNRFVKLAIIIAALVMIKRPEGILTYYLDGFAAALLLAVAAASPTLKKILEFPAPLVVIGQYTMEIFLIHSFVFLRFADRLPVGISLLVSIPFIFICVIALHWVLKTWNKTVSRLLEYS